MKAILQRHLIRSSLHGCAVLLMTTFAGCGENAAFTDAGAGTSSNSGSGDSTAATPGDSTTPSASTGSSTADGSTPTDSSASTAPTAGGSSAGGVSSNKPGGSPSGPTTASSASPGSNAAGKPPGGPSTAGDLPAGQCWCAGGKSGNQASFVLASQKEAVSCAKNIQAGHATNSACYNNAAWGICSCTEKPGWQIATTIDHCSCIESAQINQLYRNVKFIGPPKSP